MINEALNEAKAPKAWDSMFAANVIKAYKAKKLDPNSSKSIADFDKKSNGGIVPKPAFNTKAILQYHIATGKEAGK